MPRSMRDWRASSGRNWTTPSPSPETKHERSPCSALQPSRSAKVCLGVKIWPTISQAVAAAGETYGDRYVDEVLRHRIGGYLVRDLEDQHHHYATIHDALTRVLIDGDDDHHAGAALEVRVYPRNRTHGPTQHMIAGVGCPICTAESSGPCSRYCGPASVRPSPISEITLPNTRPPRAYLMNC